MQTIYLTFTEDPKENEDLLAAVDQFIKNFEAKTDAKISTHSIENNVIKSALMSGIMRLKFECKKNGESKSGVVILKVPSLAPLNQKVLKKMNIFDREAYFYEIILPALYQLGKCEPFAPKLYAATPAKALVMEDLTVEGYERVQSVFLDFNQIQLALKILAKYHALSYVYLENLKKDNPNAFLLEPFDPTIKSISGPDEFNALYKLVRPHLKRSLYQKIVKAKNEILANVATTNNKDGNSMIVIIHGDFHSRNILFKNDSQGKACQVKLLDWQFSRKANPVIDLIEFFVANIFSIQFAANEDSILNSYLDTLNHNLSLLSTNRVYNRSDLYNDMKVWRYQFFRVLAIVAPEILKLPSQVMKQFAPNFARWVIYMENKGFI